MKRNPLQKNGQGGFTYVEVLIVIAIMLILGGGIGFNGLKILERTRRISAENQIEIFRIALQLYYADCGSYPSEYQGLDALWERPTAAPVSPAWDGPYLERMPGLDPWNNAYIYRRSNNLGLPWVIISLGGDGREGGEKENADITSWE